MKKEVIKLQIKVLQELNKTTGIKYPGGSRILFSDSDINGILTPGIYHCVLYYIGGLSPDGSDGIEHPPEWQGLTYQEAKEIAGMFDFPLFFHGCYPDHVPLSERTGIKFDWTH